ncbi:hypothetical protein FOA52_002006 [Chlamydomonas sp. UWO 241]|nr:hypothetical protein FOA52_002006 [Chlamydomonas sp. UWO 241]
MVSTSGGGTSRSGQPAAVELSNRPTHSADASRAGVGGSGAAPAARNVEAETLLPPGSQPASTRNGEATLCIRGMVSQGPVESVLRRMRGVQNVTFGPLQHGMVQVEFDPALVSGEQLVAAVEDAGFMEVGLMACSPSTMKARAMVLRQNLFGSATCVVWRDLLRKDGAMLAAVGSLLLLLFVAAMFQVANDAALLSSGGAIDVWIVAGDSSAVGANSGDGQATPHAVSSWPGRIWMFTGHGQWTDAVSNIHATSGIHGFTDAAAVGPGIAFARTLILTETSHKVGLIPVGMPGSDMNAWDPSGGAAYDFMIRQVVAAVDPHMMPGAHLRGILWLQGTADAASAHLSSQHAQYLATMIMVLREELESHLIRGAEHLPLVMAVMAETPDSPYDPINEPEEQQHSFGQQKAPAPPPPLQPPRVGPMAYAGEVRLSQAMVARGVEHVVSVDLDGYETWDPTGGAGGTNGVRYLTKRGAAAVGAAMATAYVEAAAVSELDEMEALGVQPGDDQLGSRRRRQAAL